MPRLIVSFVSGPFASACPAFRAIAGYGSMRRRRQGARPTYSAVEAAGEDGDAMLALDHQRRCLRHGGPRNRSGVTMEFPCKAMPALPAYPGRQEFSEKRGKNDCQKSGRGAVREIVISLPSPNPLPRRRERAQGRCPQGPGFPRELPAIARVNDHSAVYPTAIDAGRPEIAPAVVTRGRQAPPARPWMCGSSATS
ncbi:hypothetical protein BHE75_03460 [Sphingomonas haloaromaticamans]|uniref:Uncharacterized protein n=1 Tax=Edaphosphingomonas haloaromaticamans TaxID=653954 RepID=A0A1S1HHZ3_9SPHN|nr:hypothetical protein BHE75_03460 [Sphingomonas haloaromaticamans]